MSAKIAIVLALAAAVHCQNYVAPVVAPVAPVGYRPAYDPYGYPDAPAKYEFAYEVNEPITGDFHAQREVRDGDVVQGFYSLVEADGTKRIVEYTADAGGFNAIVRKEGQPNPGYVAPGAPAYRPGYVAPVAPAYRPAYRPAVAPVVAPVPVAPVAPTVAYVK